jgi:hypothetical protein
MQKGYKDDVTSMSTTRGGHFHAAEEGQTFWDIAQDKAIRKGMPRPAGAVGCNSKLLLDGHSSVID